MNKSLDWLEHELLRLDTMQLRRQLAMRAGSQSVHIVVNGKRYLNFGSNDYLNLAADPRLREAVERTVRRGGWGSGASPLVNGRSALHGELEKKLAAFERTEAALLFPSGYAANVGTITALAGRGDIIYSDQKNHSSIIDGCRLSGARIEVYPHNNVAALAAKLERDSDARRKLIVTDSLFSMDGDYAPLSQLTALANEHQAMLMVDEAHATGVSGQRGSGVCEMLSVAEHVPIRVGTLSKALGGVGGFVAGTQTLVDWLANRARTYVFSTAFPAAAAAAGIAALGVVRDEPRRRTVLQERSAFVRRQLVDQGWQVTEGESQIIPIVVGQPEETMQIAAQLREIGCFVPGIRPPSVPEGESLLRVSLSYGHSPADLECLLSAFHTARRGKSVA